MKGYSSDIPEKCASARLEGVNASYKDLAQVCGRIRSKKAGWAVSFLQKAAAGEIPVLYKGHNKRLGHRRELGGRKGRYPKKAAKVVLKVLESALANGRTKGLGEDYTILTATANKKHVYPRIAPKGRWARSFLETSRVEIILLGQEVPKGVSVTPPAKKEEKPAKKEEAKAPEKEGKPKKAEPAKKEEKPAPKGAAKKEPETAEPEKKERPPPKILKREAKETHEHKHTEEKAHEQEKTRKEMPHQHGEHDKR